MSNDLVIVKFSDGLELYTQYQGSSDTCYPALFDTAEEAMGAGYHKLIEYRDYIKLEPVIAQTKYACPQVWQAAACRASKQFIGPIVIPEDY